MRDTKGYVYPPTIPKRDSLRKKLSDPNTMKIDS